MAIERRSILLISLIVVLLLGSLAAQNSTDLSSIDAVVNRAIQQNQIPGAVVIVGHNGQIVFRKAFGSRSLEPTREAMTVDTVFDMASTTKCLVTAVGIMQLVEHGQIRLNDPVSKYIPEFGKNGKEEITVRQLATHYSGLREDLDLKQRWAGKQAAYEQANDEKPYVAPGSEFRYSDINFIVLGELIERVSGMSLDQYASKNIFGPLAMTHTRYLPPAQWRAVTAPTEYDDDHRMMRGVVHDPTASRMGGVAGHAGVFSTADDVAKFAQAMLDGLHTGNAVLSAAAVEKMSTLQQPPSGYTLRGIGWDIDSPFSSSRGELLPVGSFGHTGFTGTSIWIDPATQTYIVILTNAVHPRPRPGTPPAVPLRSKIANIVAASLKLEPSEQENARVAAVTGYNEAIAGSRRLNSRNGEVRTGLDMLPQLWLQLQGSGKPVLPCAVRTEAGRSKTCRVGLVTNQTGIDAEGRRNIDTIRSLFASGANNGTTYELVALFSPEHGIAGALDTTNVGNSVDATTKLPIYSVYGARDAQRRPSQDVIRTLDAVIFDIQDAGVRWYTYAATLGYFLEACTKAGVPITVLDRPNPITGSFVQGAVSDSGHQSFVNYHEMPIRHGMTMGELAQMFNGERRIGARLNVIKMQGWQRGDWFDATGLPWVNPSPNLRNLNQETLYPGVALIEGTNVSVGRGTDSPFEIFGAPWIDGRQLAAYLNRRNIAGVRFVPTTFTPASDAPKFAGKLCHGVNVVIIDRNALDSTELGIELASALIHLFPQQYESGNLNEMLVNRESFDAVRRGDDPRRIADEWRDKLDEFKRVRQKYLLY